MYRLELTRRAQHNLEKLSRQDFEQIIIAIHGLREEPRHRGTKKLSGPIYRVRVGKWRIIYAVFDKDKLIIVGKIARRSEDTYNKVDELF
jgi:mRNA interferase RelE/StbE